MHQIDVSICAQCNKSYLTCRGVFYHSRGGCLYHRGVSHHSIGVCHITEKWVYITEVGLKDGSVSWVCVVSVVLRVWEGNRISI